jgi:hypothetical protein
MAPHDDQREVSQLTAIETKGISKTFKGDLGAKRVKALEGLVVGQF